MRRVECRSTSPRARHSQSKHRNRSVAFLLTIGGRSSYCFFNQHSGEPVSWSRGNAFCLWNKRSEIQNLSRSNRTQCCQRLAATATFFQKELCCPGAMTRWAPQTRYTLWRKSSIMKDLIWSFRRCSGRRYNQTSPRCAIALYHRSKEATAAWSLLCSGCPATWK